MNDDTELTQAEQYRLIQAKELIDAYLREQEQEAAPDEDEQETPHD